MAARDGLEAFFEGQPEVFQRRARHGIPVEHRWNAWMAAMRVRSRVEPGLYEEHSRSDSQWSKNIEIDLPRSFTHMPEFGEGHQSSLRRVLNAFASLDPSVGYCQGMNFVAGFLLFVAHSCDFRQPPRVELEEEVFWMLVRLMSDQHLAGFYKGNFPLLLRYCWAFEHILQAKMPELRVHFRREGIRHGLYLHQWFLTLFVNCLPTPIVLIIWDSMICGGGLEVLLPITVALLQQLQHALRSLEFEDILRFFKNMREDDPDTNATMIGRLIIHKSRSVELPEWIARKLRDPLPPEGAGIVGNLPSVEDEDFAMDGEAAAGGGWLRSLGEVGVAGVLNRWEEARGSLLRGAGLKPADTLPEG